MLFWICNFLSHNNIIIYWIIVWKLEQLRSYTTRDIWKFFQTIPTWDSCNSEIGFKYQSFYLNCTRIRMVTYLVALNFCMSLFVNRQFYCILQELIFAIVKDWCILLGTNFCDFWEVTFNPNCNIYVFFH